MPERIVIDANIIVRFLTGDDPAQSPAATELFRSAGSGKINLVIPAAVLQETVYALEMYFAGTAETIAPN